MSTISVDIVSADQTIFSGEGNAVITTASGGELGILPGHTPLLAALKPGFVKIRRDEGDESIFISGGFVEVQPNKVTILADTAERADSINEEAAERQLEKARKSLEEAKGSSVDYARAQRELLEAAARIELVKQTKKNN